MRREQTETVREVHAARASEGAPLKRMPQRTTKQMHQRLLRALGDRRIKRIFS
jgi:hypothetical protein